MKHLLPLLFTATALVATAAPAPKPVSPEFLQRIEQAMPAAAPAKPAKERRILVFFLASGFKHDSIGTANQCFEIMGRKTGAFTADFSDDMAVFTTDNLAKYDVVLFNNTTQLNFDQPGTRQALMDFVKSGKGIVGIHAATDSFYGWPEAAGMMGGLFDGHPWHAGGTWRIRVTDPEHVCNECFKGEPTFLLKDEIYQLKSPYNRNDRRLLLELDSFAPENLNVKGKKRDDDFGISWLKPFEKGRVFYCSLGHNHEIFWNTKVVAHYLAGIQYALGDLKAPDQPAPAGSAPASSSSGATAESAAIAALKSWKAGTPNTAFAELEAGIPSMDATRLADLEAALAKVAADTTATADGRDEALRMLARCGSAASVSAVSALIVDARLGSRAMWALDRNLSQEATVALREAAAKGSDAVRIAASVALGNRRDTGAVSVLAAQAGLPTEAVARAATEEVRRGGHPVEPVARAAIEALGRIGAPALNALTGLQVPAALVATHEQALLRAAGDAGSADVLRKLLSSSGNANVRGSSVTLLGRQGDAASVATALASDDRRVWQPAAAVVRELKSADAAAALAKVVPALPDDRLPAVIQSCANSGNSAFASALTGLFASADSGVRASAMEAVARLDVGSQLSTLLAAAARDDDAGKAALKALMETPADVATPLLKIMGGLSAAEQPVALSLLGSRGDRAALPSLLKSALDPADDKIGRIAADAVARIGGQGEYVALIKAVASTESLRARLIPALRTFGPRAPDADAAANAVAAAMSAGLPAREGCMLLGSLKSPAAGMKLLDLATAGDAESARMALRELGSMSSPDVLRRLAALSKDSPDATARSMALRAAARATPGSEMPEDEKLKTLETLYATAASADDRKAVLSGMGAFLNPGILPMLQKASADPELKAEVEGLQKAMQGAGWPVVSVLGATAFPAKTAAIRGAGAGYEPGAERDCIGNWTEAGTWAFWVASAAAPGKYKVVIEHACAGVAGADVDFIVAGKTFAFKVVDTGGWDKFPATELGVVDLPAGIASVEVRPRNRPHAFVMNLRSVKLTPVE